MVSSKKEGVMSAIASKIKKSENTTNMKEELVTSKMVEKEALQKEEELVTTDEVNKKEPPKSKTLRKTIDTETPVYRKDDKFRLTNRPGGVRKYFAGRQK